MPLNIAAPKVSLTTRTLASLSEGFSRIKRYISESIRHFIQNISCVKTSQKAPPTQASSAPRCSNMNKVDGGMVVKKVMSLPVRKSESLIQHVRADRPPELVFEKLDDNEEPDSLDYLVMIPARHLVFTQVKEALLPSDQKPETCYQNNSPRPVTEL
jgi:hypothetical protein